MGQVRCTLACWNGTARNGCAIPLRPFSICEDKTDAIARMIGCGRYLRLAAWRAQRGLCSTPYRCLVCGKQIGRLVKPSTISYAFSRDSNVRIGQRCRLQLRKNNCAMNEKLPDLIEGERIFFQGFDEIPGATMEMREQWRAETILQRRRRVSSEIYDLLGGVVKYGPFKGLSLAKNNWWAAAIFGRCSWASMRRKYWISCSPKDWLALRASSMSVA